MAKYEFDQNTFDEISSLLRRRLSESREDQKKSRKEIRKLGFRISDHFTGFTDLDFKKLLDSGEIEIVRNQILTAGNSKNRQALAATI